jgi:aldose 1-epimerase
MEACAMIVTRRLPLLAIFFLLAVGFMEAKTSVTKQAFGKLPNGAAVDLYTIADGPYQARIMTYGGVLVSFQCPDKQGKVADVILGFDNADGYYQNFNSPKIAYFGGLIGRYANRIGKGSFKLDGKTYDLPKNDGPNTLHGGPHGFFNQIWQAKETPNGVELTYHSKDGEEGFPGKLA